ncbi:MAG TPA: hypothetical protein PL115_00870 [Bacteroidales bacterium]|jgi:hypothetical protein|nr:hypothetical protein [Bacteroidales bacterium]HPY21555.1 hypothetical protein [Bacteroidales bacterium]HQA93515.1 hypothetical protein [Bacteroidales bacterium]HQN24543.1 hypothetical protein [Bacteroidales bacterium]HQP78396.1 hypothetical protein [Bacteroidales bacterium]
MKLKLLISALLALLVAGCTHNINLPEPAEEEGKMVTISATIPPETRVAYDDDTRTLSWQDGDQLLLVGYDGTTYKGYKIFNYSGNGNSFNGEEVPYATTYKAYYPGNVITVDLNGNLKPLPANFWQQAQNGNNSTAHLRNKILMYDETANPLNETFNLALKSSIIKFNLQNVPANVGTLVNLIWIVENEPGVNKHLRLDVTGVTFSTAQDNITAFLAFDPAVTQVTANGKVRISLIGEQTYVWTSGTLTEGKNYSVGNRYTGSVNSGWVRVVNPLSYVAAYNVNPNGTGFDNNLTACNVSGHFTWNAARTINIACYYLPSNEEWMSIVPKQGNHTYINFDNWLPTPYNDITENVVVQGANITMTSDFLSYSNLCYALRYQGTSMVSAWKYEYKNYNTNNCHMKITCRSVAASTSIDDIANEAFWSTGNGNDVVRYFPAGGGLSNQYGYQMRGSSGLFWSSTEAENNSDYALIMVFGPFDALSNRATLKSAQYTVRLFTN